MRNDNSLLRRSGVPALPNIRESCRLTGQAGELVICARKLFEKNGVSKTTMKAIAQHAQVSRELVYYYFPNKQALLDAVIDDYVEDVVESAVVWNELRRFGNTPESLRKCVTVFRSMLYDKNGERPMIRVLEELGIRDAFDARAVQEVAAYLCDCVAVEYAEYHEIEIDYVYEMFCVLIFGLVGLLKAFPDISDERLMKIVEQTLHLDMRILNPSSKAYEM